MWASWQTRSPPDVAATKQLVNRRVRQQAFRVGDIFG
jgi:hypothetical protein